LDLLTPQEESIDASTGRFRFNVEMLGERLIRAALWLFAQPDTYGLPIGFFAANTGTAAALIAAAREPGLVDAVVSRGGRPDLAGHELKHVRAPTLLIVGGGDTGVIDLHRDAYRALGTAAKELRIVPGATHVFEGPQANEIEAAIAEEWFRRYLPSNQRAHL
jgi:dienelactone hydrolase